MLWEAGKGDLKGEPPKELWVPGGSKHLGTTVPSYHCGWKTMDWGIKSANNREKHDKQNTFCMSLFSLLLEQIQRGN